jgi:Fe-S oxidoreductase
MSMAYFIANESVEASESFVSPAWACTGCFGCRTHCDHKNDVTGTLFDARSALVASSVAPPAVRRVLEQFDEKKQVLGKLKTDPRVSPWVDDAARTAVLVGCEHARHGTGVDTVKSCAKLSREGKVALVDACCGAPLLYAGDQKRFLQQGEIFMQAIKHRERVVVGDAGCASTIRLHHAALGLSTNVPILHFAEHVAPEVMRLSRASLATNARWHDPCQLGRGLGVYDAPRQILSRVLGRAPEEFPRRRDDARCSGGGGLLPVTMPGIARDIAMQRTRDHDEAGGGTIVTACASSMRSFERSGARVLDLATVVAMALE